MTTRLTESQHKGEFLVQDLGRISYETGTYASGSGTIADGTVLKSSGGELSAAAGTTNTAGDSDETIVGIAYGDIDVSAGAVSGPYIARLADVNLSLLTTSGDSDALVAALASLMIIAR